MNDSPKHGEPDPAPKPTPSEIAGAAILVSAKAQPAADGIITGRVLGETSGQYLNNARLAVRGTGLVAFTDETGSFRLDGVPRDAVTLDVFYTGTEPAQMMVDLRASRTAEREIRLAGAGRAAGDRGVVKLESLVISASREMDGAALAINEQRFAANIVNVVAADEFGIVPDGNIGEFLKMLPGITMDYRGGDPRDGLKSQRQGGDARRGRARDARLLGRRRVAGALRGGGGAHAVFPKHGRNDLGGQSGLDGGRIRDCGSGGVGEHGEARCGERDGRQESRERRPRGLHEARVIGAGDIERHHFLHSALFRTGDGGGDPRLFTGNDDLARRVEIRGLDFEVAAEFSHPAPLFSDHGRHAARSCLTGLLHQAPALGHYP